MQTTFLALLKTSLSMSTHSTLFMQLGGSKHSFKQSSQETVAALEERSRLNRMNEFEAQAEKDRQMKLTADFFEQAYAKNVQWASHDAPARQKQDVLSFFSQDGGDVDGPSDSAARQLKYKVAYAPIAKRTNAGYCNSLRIEPKEGYVLGGAPGWYNVYDPGNTAISEAQEDQIRHFVKSLLYLAANEAEALIARRYSAAQHLARRAAELYNEMGGSQQKSTIEVGV